MHRAPAYPPTHSAQVQSILRESPDTEYASHKNWIGITDKWQAYCSAHHQHEWPRSGSRSSSPDTSPSPSRTPSPVCTPPSSRTPSPEVDASPSPAAPRSFPFYDHPTASRSPPHTPSPRKKPLRSPAPSPLPLNAGEVTPRRIAARFPHARTVGSATPSRRVSNPPPRYEDRPARDDEGNAGEERMFYAVSGRNLVFKDR